MSSLLPLEINSKLSNVGTSIFTVMSALSNKHGAINLSQGFPDFDVDPLLVSLVEKHMKAQRNQYAPMAGVPSLRASIAAKVKKMYQRDLHPDTEITVTSGATQAINSAISALISPGDEVMIFEPAYDSYVPSIQLMGGIVNPVVLEGPDFRVDWDKVRQQFSPRVKMVIINTPHNPSGTIWTEHDLEQLKDLAREFSFVILSDEVYEHLVYDGHHHLSILGDEELFSRSLVCFSFGKTLHVTGWKLGYCIAPPQLTKEFRKAHQFQVFSANSPMQYAIGEYLEDEAKWTGLGTFFQAKRDLFLQYLSQTDFAFDPCAGTYFQVADYSAISNEPDIDFANWMTKEIGVAVIPISPFSEAASEQRLVRFCFAKKDQTLIEAGERLQALSK